MEEKKPSNLDLIMAGERHNVKDFKSALVAIIKLEESLLSKDREIEKMKAENESLHKYWMPTAKNEERLKDVYREEIERLKGLIDKAFEAGVDSEYYFHFGGDYKPDLEGWKVKNNLDQFKPKE
jgi:predicted ATP-dependent protease